MSEATNPNPPSTEEPTDQQIFEEMRRLGGGNFLRALYKGLVVCGAETLRTGRKSSVTGKLEISRPSEGGIMITVRDTVKVSPPTRDGSGAWYFLHEGNLHDEDPRQLKITLTAVDPIRPAVQEVPDFTPAVQTGV